MKANMKTIILILFSVISIQAQSWFIPIMTDDKEFDFYASTLGNDSFDGLTINTPKLTLGAIESLLSNNKRVGLISSGIWREQFDVDLNNITIKGVDGFARISGSDVITGWILTSGKTYTYEKSIVLAFVPDTTYNFLLAAEITIADTSASPYSSRNLLTRVWSVNDCEAITGSYYYTLNDTSTVYIHPSNDAAPNEGTYYYEVNVRSKGIEQSYNNNSLTLENIHFISSLNGLGMLNSGKNTSIKKCIFQHGNIHDIVINSGTIDQSIFIGTFPSDYNIALYSPTGTGNVSTIKNSIFYSGYLPVIVHTSDASQHQSVTYNNLRIYGNGNTNYITHSNIISSSFTNVYADSMKKFLLADDDSFTITNTVLKDVDAVLSATSGTFIVSNSFIRTDKNNAATTYQFTSGVGGASFENCIIYSKSPDVSVINQIFQQAPSGKKWNIKRNIFIFDDSLNTRFCDNNSNGVTGTSINVDSDSNVFIRINSKYPTFYQRNPNQADIKFDFYQYYSGQDRNSLWIDLRDHPDLTEIFQDPDNGDFRFANTGLARKIIDLGAGMITPPTSFPTKPTYEQAVAMMQNGSLTTPLLPSSYTPPASFTSSSSPEDTSYFNSLVTPLADSMKTNISNEIVMLKDSLQLNHLSDWGDILYLMANETEEAHLKNLIKREHDMTESGTITFTPFRGSHGDSTSSYLDLNYNPFADSKRISEMNFTLYFYVRTNNAYAGPVFNKYTNGAISSKFCAINFDNGSKQPQVIYFTGAITFDSAITDIRGSWALVQKYGTLTLYRDGVKVQTKAAVPAVGLGGDYDWYLFARNNSGTADNFNKIELSAFGFGGALDDEGVRKLDNSIKWYLGEIGARVE